MITNRLWMCSKYVNKIRSNSINFQLNTILIYIHKLVLCSVVVMMEQSESIRMGIPLNC